jgi:hypothetical protein
MYCLILDPPWVRLALAKNEPSQGNSGVKSRLPGALLLTSFWRRVRSFCCFFQQRKQLKAHVYSNWLRR